VFVFPEYLVGVDLVTHAETERLKNLHSLSAAMLSGLVRNELT
jgi:hypothetical protein